MFKNNKLIAMLLLTLVVVFAVISEYNLAKRVVLPQSPPLLARHIREGFDDDVPSCQSNGESPACYSTVRDYDEDSVYNYDDMYLKTEIVPPVCPACPTTINGHCHENEVGTSPTILGTDFKNEQQTTTTTTETETNNSVVNNYTTYNSNNNNDTATNNNSDTATNNNSDTATNNNVDTATNNNSDTATNNNSDTVMDNNNNTLMYNNSDNLLDNTLNTMKDSITPTNDNKDVEINRLKEENKRLKDTRSESDSCPPCPSCERCPEASFSCEKVINYRSPNVGNYLPIPLLNDFSTFDSQ